MRCQASVSRRFSTVQLSSKGKCIPDSRLCSLFFPIGGPTLASPTKAIGEIFREEIRLAPPSASHQEAHPRNTILSPVPPSREMSFLFSIESFSFSEGAILLYSRICDIYSLFRWEGNQSSYCQDFERLWSVHPSLRCSLTTLRYPEIQSNPIHLRWRLLLFHCGFRERTSKLELGSKGYIGLLDQQLFAPTCQASDQR